MLSRALTARTVLHMKKSALLCALVALPLVAGCTQTAVEDAISKGQEKLSALGAEAAADLLRVTLISEAESRGVSPSSAALLADVAKSVPGVALTYVDADSNDLVDKGVVTITALGKSACLILPNPASQGSVVPGACP